MMEGDVLVTNENPDAAGVETLPAIEADLFCPRCAYNLRGAVGSRCSECGYDLGNLRSPTCRIPWVRRRELGRLWAYWATVWMLLFRNRRFCEEYARPQRYADVRRFQWVTIALVFATVVAAVSLVCLVVPPKTETASPFVQLWAIGSAEPSPTLLDRAYAEQWPVGLLTVCVLPFLAAAAVMPTYFFHPRSIPAQQQDNGIVLSGYAFGAMSLVPVLFVGGLTAAGFSNQVWGWDTVPGMLVGSLAVGFGAWWVTLVRTARSTMPQLKSRLWLIGACTPVAWGALAAVFLLGLPLVIFFVLIVSASFR